MKRMKFMFAILLVSAACASVVTSCGNDDEPSSTEGGENGGGIADNLARPGKKLRRVYSEPLESFYYDWIHWFGGDYIYDEKGRLVEYDYYIFGRLGTDCYSCTLTYKGNNVYRKNKQGDGTYTYFLNKMGYADSVSVFLPNRNEYLTTVFAYSPDGYLLSAKNKEYEETFTWQDGNCVKCAGKNKVCTYVYDISLPNSYGICNIALDALAYGEGTGFTYYGGEVAFQAGILGKISKDLPSSYTYAYNGRPETYACTYCYVAGWTKEEAEEYGYFYPVYIIE